LGAEAQQRRASSLPACPACTPAEPCASCGGHTGGYFGDRLGAASGAISDTLTIGGTSDPAEHEAERAADAMTTGTSALAAATLGATTTLRRQAEASAPSNALPPAVSSMLTGPGHELDTATRAYFEPRLGRDLGAVRVHTYATAGRSAQSIGARAYVAGQHIAFAPGAYAPQSNSGRYLLAHELAHTMQDRCAATICRAPPEGATPKTVDPAGNSATPDAEQDEKLSKLFEATGEGFDGLTLAGQFGGLRAWQSKYPRSFAQMLQRLSAKYGQPILDRLMKEDATILWLYQRSAEVQARMRALEAAYAQEKEAAVNVVRYFAGFYKVDYLTVAGFLRTDPAMSLESLKILMNRDLGLLAQAVKTDADLAQADADAVLAQKEAWRNAGEAVLGQEVARREGIFYDDHITVASLLKPLWGDTDQQVALTAARFSGQMTAVVSVGGRSYAYALSKQYDRNDILQARSMPNRSILVQSGTLGAAATAITTTDGWIVSPSRGDRFFGGMQTQSPDALLEADTKLLQSGKAEDLDINLLQLFQSMLVNLAMWNLRKAEERLDAIQESMRGGSGGTPKEAGEALKKDTGRLRQLMLESQKLEHLIGPNEPTDEQLDQRDAIFTEIGTIIQTDPAAGFFVENKREANDKSPLNEDQVTDTMANTRAGDVAHAAIAEATRRKENIEAVRRALLANPSIALDFDVLHEAVLARFSPAQRTSIKINLFMHTIDKAASVIRLLAVDLMFLITGFFTGGETWLGFAVHGAGAAFGATQVAQQVQDAKLLEAMSSVDVNDGFALATKDQVRSARNWAIFSVAMSFLGMVGLARTAGRLMEAGARESELVSRIAQRSGVGRDVLEAALRKNWRGIPDPDPSALRQILLAQMDPALARRYQDIPIAILSEQEWASRYGANSASHAATELAKAENGEVMATKVLFRRNGNVLAMAEEGEHIAQTANPAQAGEIGRLAEMGDMTVDAWNALTAEQRLQRTRDVLKLEHDAQEVILARAQTAGDTDAADDAFARMEEMALRLNDVDQKLTDPTSTKLYRWFNPELPPTLFNEPRLPRSMGTWSGPPGNSVWKSKRPEVILIVGEGGIRFRNGYPNFQPWSKATVKLEGMSGLANDFSEADFSLARRWANEPPPGTKAADFLKSTGEPNPAAIERYRVANRLTWHHHQGGNLMLLVPRDLHANIPHTGGASAARAGEF